jgi:hypothetical protein
LVQNQPEDKESDVETSKDVLENGTAKWDPVRGLMLSLQDPWTRRRVNEVYEAARQVMEHGKPRRDLITPQRFKRIRRMPSAELLKREYAKGQSLRQLAVKHKVDRKTVASRLRKAGVKLRKPSCNVWKG